MSATNAVGHGYQFFALQNSHNLTAFRMTSAYLADTAVNKRAGWIKSLHPNIELVIYNCPIHSHIKNLKSIKLFFIHQT